MRERLRVVSEEAELPLVCPAARLCVDNGVMVAWAGMERLALNVPEFLEAPPSLEQAAAEAAGEEEVLLKPRWPLGEKDKRGVLNSKGQKTSRTYPSLTEVSRPGLQAAEAAAAAAASA